MNVKEIGEQGILALLQKFCPADIIGDDGALLSLSQDGLVITTDMLVDGVHFSDRTTAPEDVGWRSVAANLSDLAAMGASPVGITVALGLPPDTPVAWLERLYQGMTECLQFSQTPIVGGDVCRSSTLTVAITALGQVEPSLAIRRSAAQVDQAIVATGLHGAARGGLELLLHPEQGQHLSQTERQTLIRAHQRPCPRLDVLPILRTLVAQWEQETGLEGSHLSIAGMDSSDGLADAILQICRASGVGAQVDRSQIPIPAPLQGWVPETTALNWALYGGEDFELVLCLPPVIAQKLVDHLKKGAAIVGKTTSGTEVWLIEAAPKLNQRLSLTQGFQHF